MEQPQRQHALWRDEYWLLLMQVYHQKPVGLKPTYSRQMVSLAMEIHISPRELYERAFRLRTLPTTELRRIWDIYNANPRRLAKECARIRGMEGFGKASIFYEGVEQNMSFERLFLPVERRENIKPVMLIMILDLYFQLTTITMVEETPEVIDLARCMRIKPKDVVEVLTIYQTFDPCLSRSPLETTPLVRECEDIWHRFGNDSPDTLSSVAHEMVEYFR